ncbi:hypothetical protein GCM10028822_38120 [Hymenobacter terrigena]
MPANVNFSSERGVPFGLVLDGRPLTRGMARQVHVDQLMPGQHWADFSVPTAYGGAVRFRSRVWLEPGLETTFVLVTRPGRPLYLQQVNAVALYAPGYGGNGYYNNGGRYNSPAPYGQGGGYGNQGSYGNDPYNNGGYNAAPIPNTGPSYGTNPNYPSGGGYGNNPNFPSGGGYGNNPNTPNGGGYNTGPTPGNYPGTATSSYRSLAPQDVDALVKNVQGRISEASKLSAAKDGLAQRSLRADELSRLLRTINSEACRIDLATFAYSHVSDPENFNRVYDVFETESGAKAVEDALNNASQR